MKIEVTESGAVLTTTGKGDSISIIGADGVVEQAIEIKDHKNINAERDKIVKEFKAKKKLAK